VRLDQTLRGAPQAQGGQVGERLHAWPGMIAVVNDAEILAVAGVLAGAACHSATGFGFALVAAPIVVAALPPETAVSTVLFVGILTSLMTLTTERRVPSPLWGESAQLVAVGAVGAVAGALLLERLDRTALQVLVSVSVIAALVTRETARRRGRPPAGRAWLAPAGFAAGALTTTTTATGPPLLLYLFGRRVAAARMRDTLSVLFASFNCIGLAAIAISAGLALPRGTLLAVLGAAALAGHLAGRPAFARLAAGHYEQVVATLLLASVLVGAVVALA
jgi:uncharacterized membrane protein YfcA